MVFVDVSRNGHLGVNKTMDLTGEENVVDTHLGYTLPMVTVENKLELLIAGTEKEHSNEDEESHRIMVFDMREDVD